MTEMEVHNNIIRAVDGLAQEIARRVTAERPVREDDGTYDAVYRHAGRVLIDYMLGEFNPSEHADADHPG